MIKLDILSDPICPWCFIGKTYLDRALEAHAEHPFLIEWHPFQLNPNMPVEGMDRREYLERKFGGQKGAIEVYSQIDRAAQEAGLTMYWEGITRTPNTSDAHRLIHWAGIEGRQSPVVSALFRAYFLEGKDIGNRNELIAVAEKTGMDGDLVKRLLYSDSDKDGLQKREAHSREMGVNSVPTFIVDNHAVVPGAQKPEFWEDVIQDIIADGNAD